MLKKYTLSPRVPVYIMSALLLTIGVGGAFFDALNQTRPLRISFYLGWIALNLFIIPVSYWWFSKARIIKNWEEWAFKHQGKYERPAKKYISGYGNVMDELSGIDKATGKYFHLYRTLYVPMRSSIQSRRGPSSSVLLSNSDDLSFPQEFKVVRSYLIHVPTVEDILTESTKSF